MDAPANTVVPLGPGPTGGTTTGTVAVDLTEGDNVLCVDISDALSEVDKVKFTVHTRTSMPRFGSTEFSVIRLHEEFVWLHDTFSDNPEYGGYIIPPPPPRPDFDASREKLRKLGDAEGTLTKEEFNKMKQELEAEYLATFKKTVAMHETFLCRLASHPVFRNDLNLAIYLEYDKELNVRGKNKKERLFDVFSSMQKSGDELLLSNTVKDCNEFFENERRFLLDYFNHMRDATHKSDKMVVLHKSLAENYIKISSGFMDLSALDETNRGSDEKADDKSLVNFLTKASDVLEKMRRIEGRVASDQDLKLSDTLRYHMRDTNAAKDLLFRRLKCLNAYENANKTLEKARAKNKDVIQAENGQQEACKNFENISDLAKEELKNLRQRRVVAFQKSLTELAELELKHSKAHAQMLRTTIANLKAEL